jgi:signal transduction histidine kinase/Tfp pilus assembly protein PilF
MMRFFLIGAYILVLLSARTVLGGDLYVDSLLKEINNQKSEKHLVELLRELAYVTSGSNPEKSIQYADSAIILAKKINWKRGIGDSYTDKAIAVSKNRNIDEYGKYLDSALTVYETNNIVEGLAKVYYHKAVYHKKNRERNESEKYYRMCVKLSKQNHLFHYQSLSLIKLAATEYMRSEIDSAVYYADEAVVMLKKSEIKSSRRKNRAYTVIYNTCGNIFSAIGDFDRSLESYFRALEVMEKISYHKGIAVTSNGIANVYLTQNNIEKAEEYYNYAISYSEEYGFDKISASAYLNYGAMLVRDERYELAKAKLRTALQIAEGNKSITSMILVKINLGHLFIAQNNPVKALNYYIEADELCKENNNLNGQASTKGNIGISYYKIFKEKIDFDLAPQELVALAISNLNEGVELASKIKAKDHLSKYHQHLYEIYTETRDFENALKNYISYKSIQDSINDVETSVKIANLEAVRDNYEKSKENELLEEDINLKQRIIIVSILGLVTFLVLMVFIFIKNKKLSKLKNELSTINNTLEEKIDEKTKDLKAANKEKVDLLNLFSHTFKTKIMHLQEYNNNYPILYGALNDIDAQVLERLDKEGSKDIREIFEQKKEYKNLLESGYHKSIDIMKKVIELMSDMRTSIAIKENEFKINTQLIPIKNFCYFVNSFNDYGFINQEQTELIKMDISAKICDENIFILSEESRLLMLLKILISNSLEYTSYTHVGDSREPEIKIKMFNQGENIVLQVIDNGSGFSEQAMQNLGKIVNNGADVYNTFDGLGLGLFIANEIVNQFSAKLEVKNNDKFGATVSITFPKVLDNTLVE